MKRLLPIIFAVFLFLVPMLVSANTESDVSALNEDFSGNTIKTAGIGIAGGVKKENIAGSENNDIWDLRLIDYSKFTIDEEMVDLANACNTNYGYQDLLYNVCNQEMITLYEMIDDIYQSFFASSADAYQNGGSYNAGAIGIHEGLLTDDEILQTWTVYRMDHPLYYWIPQFFSSYLNDGTIIIELSVYNDYVSGSVRGALYTGLCNLLSQFVEYTTGGDSCYTYATASLYKLVQIVNYAWMSPVNRNHRCGRILLQVLLMEYIMRSYVRDTQSFISC